MVHLEEVSGPREYANDKIAHLIMPEISAAIIMKKEATNPEADIVSKFLC